MMAKKKLDVDPSLLRLSRSVREFRSRLNHSDIATKRNPSNLISFKLSEEYPSHP